MVTLCPPTLLGDQSSFFQENKTPVCPDILAHYFFSSRPLTLKLNNLGKIV
jgi:hypothetical protein